MDFKQFNSTKAHVIVESDDEEEAPQAEPEALNYNTAQKSDYLTR